MRPRAILGILLCALLFSCGGSTKVELEGSPAASSSGKPLDINREDPVGCEDHRIGYQTIVYTVAAGGSAHANITFRDARTGEKHEIKQADLPWQQPTRGRCRGLLIAEASDGPIYCFMRFEGYVMGVGENIRSPDRVVGTADTAGGATGHTKCGMAWSIAEYEGEILFGQNGVPGSMCGLWGC